MVLSSVGQARFGLGRLQAREILELFVMCFSGGLLKLTYNLVVSLLLGMRDPL